MAKKTYLGVNGYARKVKNIYIGINGYARKVKKIYIGVNGIARQCYGSAELRVGLYNSSNATSGEINRTNITYGMNGNYLFAAGGHYTDWDAGTVSNKSTCATYNSSFTRSTASALGTAGDVQVVGNVGDWIIFAGRNVMSYKSLADGSTEVAKLNGAVTAYNSSLTKQSCTSISEVPTNVYNQETNVYTGGTVGNKSYVAVFTNTTQGDTYYYGISYYNSSLTRSITTRSFNQAGSAYTLQNYLVIKSNYILYYYNQSMTIDFMTDCTQYFNNSYGIGNSNKAIYILGGRSGTTSARYNLDSMTSVNSSGTIRTGKLPEVQRIPNVNIKNFGDYVVVKGGYRYRTQGGSSSSEDKVQNTYIIDENCDCSINNNYYDFKSPPAFLFNNYYTILYINESYWQYYQYTSVYSV